MCSQKHPYIAQYCTEMDIAGLKVYPWQDILSNSHGSTIFNFKATPIKESNFCSHQHLKVNIQASSGVWVVRAKQGEYRAMLSSLDMVMLVEKKSGMVLVSAVLNWGA